MPLSSTCPLWIIRELGLEFVPVVGSDFPDPERELVDDVGDEFDGIGLGVPFVHLHGPHTGCIVDGCVLVAPGLAAVISFERQELDVHLDVVAGNLLVVALGVNLAHPRPTWEPVQTSSLTISWANVLASITTNCEQTSVRDMRGK